MKKVTNIQQKSWDRVEATYKKCLATGNRMAVLKMAVKEAGRLKFTEKEAAFLRDMIAEVWDNIPHKGKK